jgi:hypothetical protein
MTAWRPPKASQTFEPRMGAHLEHVRRTVGSDSFEMYLLGCLVADKKGRIPKGALDAMNALLDSGAVEVGYDRLADGAVRVWYREVAS